MKMCSLLMAFVLVIGLAPKAFADGQLPAAPFPNAEHTHQAESDSFELTPGIETDFFTLKSTTVSTSEDFTGVALKVKGEYGFNEMLSAGAVIGYGESTTTLNSCVGICNAPKSDGLLNPEIFGKFKYGIGPGTVKAILDFKFTLANAKTNSSNKSNEFTGGDTGNLALAYEFMAGPGLLGAKISYDIWNQDRKRTNELSPGLDSETTSGGASFAADVYYEYKYRNATFGGLVHYEQDAATSTDDGISNTSDNNKKDIIGFGLYVPVLVAQTITLYPEFDYGHVGVTSDAGIHSFDDFKVNFSARFVF